MGQDSILHSINPSTPLILASGSQSRKIMLEDAGINFDIITSDVDEDIIKKQISELPFKDQVIKLAAAKAIKVSNDNP